MSEGNRGLVVFVIALFLSGFLMFCGTMRLSAGDLSVLPLLAVLLGGVSMLTVLVLGPGEEDD